MHGRGWRWRPLRPLTRPLVAGTLLVGLFLSVVNGAVAFLGDTEVFPFSPLHLEAKLHALELYALHRPRCLLFGHADVTVLAQQSERRYGLPPGLLQALIGIESGSRPHRISPTGAMGLAQLMPQTAAMLGVRDPYDSAAAIDGGARYLQSLYAQFHDIRLAVAAYNAGPGAITARTIPRNGETEYYVPRVMARYTQLAPAPPARQSPIHSGVRRRSARSGRVASASPTRVAR